jgi:hypothetical protein
MKLQNFQGKPQKNQVHQILGGTNQKEVKHPSFLHQHGREHPKSKHSHNITQRRRRNNPAAQKKKKKKKKKKKWGVLSSLSYISRFSLSLGLSR